jgi:glucosylceramidase
VAPVIVDQKADEVYFTPLYYTMAHFSKFIRPGAKVLTVEASAASQMMITSAQNPDGSIAVVVFNPTDNEISFDLVIGASRALQHIQAKAIQTIYIPAEPKEIL